MAQPGRPLKSLDPDASHAARLGYEIRSRRIARDLTLEAFGNVIGFSPQQISAVELATAQPSPKFVAACERALEAEGALEKLLPAVHHEQALLRYARSAARAGASPAVRFARPHQDGGEVEDVDPTTRRGLLDVGAVTALGGLGVFGAAAGPAAAREVDPELPEHWTNLLRLLGRHDEVFGPRDVLASVRREISLIAEHRQAARGKLRSALMRVEARWAELAAWLSEDTRQRHARDAGRCPRAAARAGGWLLGHARLRSCPPKRVASDARQATVYAEDALRVPGTNAQTRAWCLRQAAISHAMAGDAASCERYMADAYGLLDDDSPAPPWAGECRVARTGTIAAEARCWPQMSPAKAVRLYEDALGDWPQVEARDGGVHQARLAIACAQTGEIDRAKAEGGVARWQSRGRRRARRPRASCGACATFCRLPEPPASGVPDAPLPSIHRHQDQAPPTHASAGRRTALPSAVHAARGRRVSRHAGLDLARMGALD